KNDFSIIDWEGNLRGLVLIDGLDFLRRYLQKKKKRLKEFVSAFKEGKLTPEGNSILQNFMKWQNSQFQLPMIEDPSLLVLIYVIERTLILWEVRRVNRLDDKKGIEYQILLK